jgi:hypothetical protein
MTQRANSQALSISKICDAQREFDAAVRALNDFFLRKKRGSTGMLLTPTRSLHEKGLVSLCHFQKADVCMPFPPINSIFCRLLIIYQSFQPSALSGCASAPPALHPQFVDFLRRCSPCNGALLCPALSYCPVGLLTPPYHAFACPLLRFPPQLLPTSPLR